MKFWGWMHHKFRENSKEPMKDATTGSSYSILSAHPSLDSQDVYPTTCAGSRYSTRCRKQVNLFQESSFAVGNDDKTFLDGPATPTLGDTTIDTTDVTENDLKLINNELEKFLEVEANEGYHQPSGRNSDTNIIASTIEGLDAEEDNQPMKFPLQEYLFGSFNESSETKIAGRKERASLGELFQITEVQDKQLEDIYGRKKKQTSSAHKSAKHLVKKVLKKIHPSIRSSVNGKTEVDSTKKKFQKMVQVFHRKVHPEDSQMESEIYSSMANPENRKGNSIDLAFEKVNPCYETSKRCIQYELSSRSAKNGEHWIKTDEDYFVLEL